jgi:hypothetical protein
VGHYGLVGKVPLDIRRALNLPADAKGIDGVFRTKAGREVRTRSNSASDEGCSA